MVLSEIEKLLKKYDSGETSIKEEKRIKAYFLKNEIPPHLESYKMMFQYFNAAKKDTYLNEVTVEKLNNKKKPSRIYQWVSIAAVAILMLGIFVPNIMGDEPARTMADLTPPERKAYEHTKEALSMLSNNFNDAASSVGTLGFMGAKFEEGTQKVMHIKEFSKTTNRLIKKKQTIKN